MYYLSKSIVFVAVLIAACTVAWWIAPVGLIAGALFIQQPKGGRRG
jgi:hypothetical protein